jgi:hypothetical protein
MNTIRDILNILPVQGSTGSLPQLGIIAGIKPFPKRKSLMVDVLVKFYSNEENIVGILRRIKPFERELLEEYIRSSGYIDKSEILEIAKNNRVKIDISYGMRFVQIFDKLSPAKLLFVGTSEIPAGFISILKKHVKPYVIQYTPIEKIDPEAEIIGEIILRESFKDDFVRFIRLVNTTKLTVTKASALPTKSAAIKIDDALVNKEVITVDSIRNFQETTRIFGLYMLLLAVEVIKQEDGVLTLTPQAVDFIKQCSVDMCGMLLEAYIVSSSIYELDRVRELKVKTQYDPSFEKCRETILKHLCECPVDKWISLQEFLKNIKKTDRNFLSERVGEIWSYSDYDSYYYGRSQGWSEIEGRFIEVVLLEYLNTIGIIDAVVSHGYHSNEYGNRETNYPSLEFFKLTPMGAYIIGATDKYELIAGEKDSGFAVLPNYDIVVTEGANKQVHNLFFDRFAQKVADDAASIYKLTFKSIVDALDNGITVGEITEYLEEHSTNPLPDNVRKTLEDWEKESKRIRIRKVTILETDDKYLMEELKSRKTISRYIREELPHVVEIDEKVSLKLKREIEKNNRFCSIDS